MCDTLDSSPSTAGRASLVLHTLIHTHNHIIISSHYFMNENIITHPSCISISMNYFSISIKNQKAEHFVWELFFSEDGHLLMFLGEIR